MRTLIQSAESTLVEHIKWKAPSFQAKGSDCITLKLYPQKAVQVVFHRDAKTKTLEDLRELDTSGLIKWAAPDRGFAQFASLEEIEARAEAFTDFAQRWVSAVSRTD